MKHPCLRPATLLRLWINGTSTYLRPEPGPTPRGLGGPSRDLIVCAWWDTQRFELALQSKQTTFRIAHISIPLDAQPHCRIHPIPFGMHRLDRTHTKCGSVARRDLCQNNLTWRHGGPDRGPYPTAHTSTNPRARLRSCDQPQLHATPASPSPSRPSGVRETPLGRLREGGGRSSFSLRWAEKLSQPCYFELLRTNSHESTST